MIHKAESEEAAVVLLGSFNPAIFQPSWLGSTELIGKTEAEKATDLIVSEQLTSFKVGSIRIQVMRERFSAVAENAAHFEVLRDLVAGVFKLLEHTPIRAMGVNRLAHYKVESEARWHAIGDALAPKQFWDGLLSYPKAPRKLPGMRSLTIEGLRPGSEAKSIRIKVEPSFQVKPDWGLL